MADLEATTTTATGADAPRLGEAGSGFLGTSVEAGGSVVRAWSKGVGTTLVHLHGGPGPLLTRAHDLLAEHMRVVALEMPGFGASAVNPAITSPRAMAEVLLEAVAALALDHPAIWGTSTGGAMALWMAALDPASFSALVLESPAAIRPDDHNLRAIPPQEMPGRIYVHPERVFPLMPPPNPDVQRKQDAVMAIIGGPNRDADLESRLGQVTAPVLVVFGQHDGMIPPTMGSEYIRLLPHCSVALMDNAAHGIQEEQPEVLASLLAAFLRGGGPFAEGGVTAVVTP